MTGAVEFARPGGIRGGRGEAIGKLVDALEPMAVDALGRQDRRRRLTWATLSFRRAEPAPGTYVFNA